MGKVSDLYRQRIASGALRHDDAQAAVLPHMDRVLDQLQAAPPQKPRSAWRAFLGVGSPDPVPAVQGLYLWGGVGRGKSMLMDLMADAAGDIPTRRVHFHEFMQEIQAGLNEARKRGEQDTVRPVAEAVAAQVRLLCFDEMQITDIADAMIVGRLFEQLFAAGTTVVTTSNRVPDDLYKDGLNRQLFLPFIALLKERMVVRELASERDHRQDRLAGAQVYFTPVDAAARKTIDALWEELTHGLEEPLTLHVQGRQVDLPRYHNGVARASFFDLCGRMLGPADYLKLAESVRVLIIENVPRLSRHNFNEARRFVTLIDALYEAKVKLIASAAAQPEMLYVEGTGSFEFERTASRLREMQAADWST